MRTSWSLALGWKQICWWAILKINDFVVAIYPLGHPENYYFTIKTIYLQDEVIWKIFNYKLKTKSMLKSERRSLYYLFKFILKNQLTVVNISIDTQKFWHTVFLWSPKWCVSIATLKSEFGWVVVTLHVYVCMRIHTRTRPREACSSQPYTYAYNQIQMSLGVSQQSYSWTNAGRFCLQGAGHGMGYRCKAFPASSYWDSSPCKGRPRSFPNTASRYWILPRRCVSALPVYRHMSSHVVSTR